MIEILYDGKYPTTCMGTLIIKEDDKEVYNKQFCCHSTGCVRLEGDPKEWNFVIDQGELLWNEDEAFKFSDEIQNAVKDKLSESYVCCGGCI